VYPRQRRLDAFSSGQAVNVSAGSVFGWNAIAAGVSPVPRPAGRLPERVVVSPDDRVTYTDEDWAALFIEESGL
jgi:hypothetical protein